MSHLSSTHGDCRDTHCGSDPLEIRFEMFSRYLVADIPNRNCHDVFPHAGADVSLQPINPSSSSPAFRQRHPKTDAPSPHIPFRRTLSALVGSLPVTTAFPYFLHNYRVRRKPPAASFKSRYRKSREDLGTIPFCRRGSSDER